MVIWIRISLFNYGPSEKSSKNPRWRLASRKNLSSQILWFIREKNLVEQNILLHKKNYSRVRSKYHCQHTLDESRKGLDSYTSCFAFSIIIHPVSHKPTPFPGGQNPTPSIQITLLLFHSCLSNQVNNMIIIHFPTKEQQNCQQFLLLICWSSISWCEVALYITRATHRN